MTTLSAAMRSGPVLQLAVVSVVVGTATSFAFPFHSLFLTTEVGVSPLALSTFMLISPVAAVVASTVLGKLSDTRVRRRVIMVFGALAGVVGYGLFAVLRDYWLLLAVSATFIAVVTSLLPQTFAYGGQLEHSGPMVITSLRMLISVAWVAGPPLAAALVAASGFTGLFVVIAVLYVLVAVVASRLPVPLVTPVVHSEEPRGGGFAVPAVAFTFLQGATALAVAGLPLFVISDLRGTAGDAGLVLGLCAALEIPLMLWFGMLASRMSLHRLVLAGAAFALAYHGAMLVTATVWQVAAVQLVHAVAISAVMGIGISYFQSLAPDRPGHASTLFANTATAGTMVAGVLLGVAQQVGFRSTYAMSLAMSVIGLALLVLAGKKSRLNA